MPGPWDFFNYDFNAIQNPQMGWYQDLPKMLADQFAQVGITPGMFAADPHGTTASLSANSNPSLGESMVPLPTPDPRKAGGGTDLSAKGKQGGLADMLKGLKAPSRPQAPNIKSPPPPRTSGSIKGGDLLALLSAMGNPAQASGLKLPPTLGTALSKFRGY